MSGDHEDARARGAAAARAIRRGSWTGLDQASVMGVELIAAILTWAGIGWLVDRRLGTAPWFLAVGALVGNAAGLYLVWLRGMRLQAGEERRAGEARTGHGDGTEPLDDARTMSGPPGPADPRGGAPRAPREPPERPPSAP